MRVTMVAAADPAWEEHLQDLPHDVYHAAGYHRFEQRRGCGEPWLFVAETSGTSVVWPYLLRPVTVRDAPTGRTDVTSSYGYCGPLVRGTLPDEETLRAVRRELAGVWREQQVVSAFARLHPVLDNRDLARDVGPDPGAGGEGVVDLGDGVVDLGETVSIDCTVPDEEAIAGYAQPLRRHVEKAAARGYRVVEDVGWRQLEEFVRIYDESMDRNAADDFYRFSVEDFRFLRDALSGRVHLLLISVDGEVLAGGVFTQSSGIVQAHLQATATAYLPTSPSKALLDGARRWARAAGYRTLHVGGGRGGRNDSLFRFKREFSKRRHPFAIGRWVVDHDAYHELCRQAGPVNPGSDYFPAYRAAVRAVPATAIAAQNQENRES